MSEVRNMYLSACIKIVADGQSKPTVDTVKIIHILNYTYYTKLYTNKITTKIVQKLK